MNTTDHLDLRKFSARPFKALNLIGVAGAGKDTFAQAISASLSDRYTLDAFLATKNSEALSSYLSRFSTGWMNTQGIAHIRYSDALSLAVFAVYGIDQNSPEGQQILSDRNLPSKHLHGLSFRSVQIAIGDGIRALDSDFLNFILSSRIKALALTPKIHTLILNGARFEKEKAFAESMGFYTLGIERTLAVPFSDPNCATEQEIPSLVKKCSRIFHNENLIDYVKESIEFFKQPNYCIEAETIFSRQYFVDKIESYTKNTYDN